MRVLPILLCVAALLPVRAPAQSTVPQFSPGQILTAAQLTAMQQAKVDVAGGSSTGQKLTTPSVTGGMLDGAQTVNGIVASTQSRTLAAHLGDVVNVLDYGADNTGATDAVGAINQAIATGRNVYIPQGRYTITAGWIDMTTPGQRVYCDGPQTTLTVARAGYAPSPALVIEAGAVGAEFLGCTIDHNGAQFLGTGPFVPLAWNNTTNGTHTNDGLGIAVLVMADYARFEGAVTRGWDTCIGLGRFDFQTGQQTASPAPKSPVVTHAYTSYCGIGSHSYTPIFRQGPGVDVLTATGAIVSDSVDYMSYGGFWIDTSGGANAQFVNLTSWYAQRSPTLFTGGWGYTPGGVAFYLSGSNEAFDGSTGPLLAGSSCTNCTAIQPQMQGLVTDLHSNGLTITNFHVSRSGMQCIWQKSGHTVYNNVQCDTPNYLAGQTIAAGETPAPQVAAVQIDASNTSDVTAPDILHTLAEFHALSVTSAGSPSYIYTLSLGSYGNNPAVKLNGVSLTPGTAGTFYRGAGALSILDPSLYAASSLVSSSTAPVIASGFGTGPTLQTNGSAAFSVTVGTSPGSSGVLTLPAAYHGWVCDAADITTQSATVFQTRQTGSTTTTVALANFTTSGAQAPWLAGDTLLVKCSGY
ncbi:glycosyl hydrolase family 28-related protein [Gluconacetobacter diazotrophicus]|nr:glycosyl hydrolase family 28-related protein [Gluconacetobacter diazotrophicus]